MSNVYQRLQVVRDALRSLDIKPTGRNESKDYTFYETADFWPHAVKLFAENGLFTYVSFGVELATLTILVIEDPKQQIQFFARTSIFRSLGSPVQDQAGADTYVKRRLYLTALELIEKDPVDGDKGKGKPKKPTVEDRFNDAAAEATSDTPRDPYDVKVTRRKGVKRGKA